MSAAEQAQPARQPGVRVVLAVREARALLLAQATSDLGDQVARVAIALLVLERTDQLVLAALALAIAYVPGIFGMAVLGSLADRLPRRALMLWCDLARALLVAILALVAVPAIPVWVPLLILLLSETVTAPFATARASLYADVLPDRERLVVAQGMSRSIQLSAQVVGFVIGGMAVALVGSRLALWFDALTFLISYLLVRTAVTPRPAADVPGTSARLMATDLRTAVRELLGDPVRRWPVILGWLSAVFLVAPEAVALGWTDDQSPLVGGLLLAAVPAGSAVGLLLLPRLSLQRQTELVLPLAGLSCLPLFATSINPPAAVAWALWFISGVLQAFVLTIIALVTVLTRRERRGRVLGLAASGFNAATAVAFVLVGWIAGLIGPAKAVSLAGAAGMLAVALIWRAWPAARLAGALSASDAEEALREQTTALREQVAAQLAAEERVVLPTSPDDQPTIVLDRPEVAGSHPLPQDEPVSAASDR